MIASIEMSRHRLFMKTRRSSPLSQNPTPRWTNPVPFGTWPHSVMRGSKVHSGSPASGSSATTLLYDVLTYMTPSRTMGVFSKLPGRTGLSGTGRRGPDSGPSPVSHSHAIRSSATFSRFTWSSGECFVDPWSAPQYGHSWAAAGPEASSANATTALMRPAPAGAR